MYSKTLVINTHLNETVLSLKEKLNDKESVPIQNIKLNFAGKYLDDKKKLKDYNILKESTIYLHFQTNSEKKKRKIIN
jgi:ubiquitin-large subunit ribosomal protein L40e